MERRKGHRKGGRVEHGFIINEKITDDQVRVIHESKGNLGVMKTLEARGMADEDGLDLVQIGKDPGKVTIAKIMDFGKFLYEKKKQQNLAKKKQKVIEVKEVKLRPNIDVGDFDLKVRRATKFLQEGKNVKITIMFRGREIGMKSTLGPNLFSRVLDAVNEGLEGGVASYQKETGGGAMWTQVLAVKKK